MLVLHNLKYYKFEIVWTMNVDDMENKLFNIQWIVWHTKKKILHTTHLLGLTEIKQNLKHKSYMYHYH